MDLLHEFDDYMNAQRELPAATATAATTAVEMDAATDTAATAAPKRTAEKRKRGDSPAGVEIAASADAARASFEIDASTVAVEIEVAIAVSKDRATTEMMLASVKEATELDPGSVDPGSVERMAYYKKNMLKLEAVAEVALETQDRAFKDAITKIPELARMADKLKDQQCRQALKAKVRRASRRGLVQNLYAVVTDGILGALTWKTDETFTMASKSNLKKVISNGHFGQLAYFDFDRELEQYGFMKSEVADYRHKSGHFRRDRPDLLANIVRESEIAPLQLQAKVLDVDRKITQLGARNDAFSEKLDRMLSSFQDK